MSKLRTNYAKSSLVITSLTIGTQEDHELNPLCNTGHEKNSKAAETELAKKKRVAVSKKKISSQGPRGTVLKGIVKGGKRAKLFEESIGTGGKCDLANAWIGEPQNCNPCH